MASAYVALLSLSSTIEQHQHTVSFPDIFQVDYLKENTIFLLQFFEDYHGSQITCQDIQILETRTSDVAIEAGCMIDSHAMDEMLFKQNGCSGDNTSQLFPHRVIYQIMKEFESIKELAMKIIKDVKENEAQLSINGLPFSVSRCTRSAENSDTMVGFDKHLIEVMWRITSGHQSTLLVLPIVGTGGHCVENIILSFLHDLKIVHENMSPHSHINELGDKLYKALFGRRYLIVMDDIWSAGFWDMIGRFFPKNDNGSRIIITTRLLRVATRIGSSDPYKLGYLDEDESWNLLQRKAFAQDHGCPSMLEDVGRRIAASCKGLPLAIVVIAGQLAKSDMTIESWENVARALISILHSENDSQCLKILSLSYDNLPIHLKPCFLYMGFFREGYELPVSKMIKYWVADGLLKPVRDKCLEDVAMEYLTDLVERNLISVSKRGSIGKRSCFRIHDLLHDLCLRKSHEHRFLYSRYLLHLDHTLGMETKCNINTRRTIKCNVPVYEFSRRYIDHDLSTSTWGISADAKLWDFRLRYIELSSSRATNISSLNNSLATISMFQNLQTLKIEETPGNEPVVLPLEIWEMPLFRHLLIKQVVLPDPPTAESHVTREEHTVLANLQTLWDVRCFKLSEEVIKRIPNLKKLRITYSKEYEIDLGWPFYCLHNLAELCRLESLSVSVCRKISAADISLPRSLRKLTLHGCNLPWEEITMVGSLPNLEVLKLQNDAFYGREWKPIEGEFCKLKALHLRNMSFQQWEADSSHFPRLERLFFDSVWRLKEIPLSIGDISTLKFISARFCRFSLELSTRRLLVGQRSLENNDIEVEIPRQSGNFSYVMQLVRSFLLNFLHSNIHQPHEWSVMIEKFEDNLCQLQSFLSYAARTERNDERLKELVKRIRDVMYEGVDVAYTAAFQADKGKSLSYSLRMILFVMKEVEYVTVRVQRLLFSDGEGWDHEEFASYKDPPHLIDWNTDDEAYNFRLLQMISHHMNKLDPDWLQGNPGKAKYLEPVGSSSRVPLIFSNFALLTAIDGISVENEMSSDQNFAVHFGITCDYCEMEPIVGIRYRCKDCVEDPGFDLCEECYSSRLVSNHPASSSQEHTSEHEFETLTSRTVGMGG